MHRSKLKVCKRRGGKRQERQVMNTFPQLNFQENPRMQSQTSICNNKTYNHSRRAMLWKSTRQEDEVLGGVLPSTYQSKHY